MSTKLIIIDPQEIQIIQEHRRLISKKNQLLELRKNCKHEFYYAGHGHNDDCFECRKCGQTEWR
jgi:predicted metal-binding protein